MVSFRGQKKLRPRLDRSPLGVLNSKFPTSIPTPFICGVPPRGGGLNATRSIAAGRKILDRTVKTMM